MSLNQNPSVSGISPREGTPGTKLTIRGENLGISSDDIVQIWMNKYDVSCTMQWHSTKKLNIISSLGEGIIKIIVVTKSGGRGSCDVEYYQSVSQNVGLQDQVSYWPPNEQKQYQVLSSYSKRIQPKQMQSEMIEGIKDIMRGNQDTPMGFAISDDDLSKIYAVRGSTALTEPDFNPIMFLLKYYRSTDYDDLVKLLDHYKTALASEKVKEPISIVKANLYTIFQCLECLEALKTKIDDEKSMARPMSGAFAENELCRTLEESKNIAHHMYEEVLKRRDYADSARSALSVMQRFRFLFNLPRSIRENIGKGEYSLVINDYLRARSLFGNSEIRLFQQVYMDVVDVIDKFKEMLRRQLLEMPTKCDAVKITIRLMRQLEVDYDPTLVCLHNQRDWILRSIKELESASFSSSSGYKARQEKSTPSFRKEPIVLMVEELNKLLSDRFSETWSLMCYYLELESSGKGETTMGPMKERTAQIEEIVQSVVGAYSAKVRETLLQGTLQSGWLVYCVQQVRQAIEALPIDDLPVASTADLVELLEELRVRSIRALLVRAEQDIVGLSFKEKWIAEIIDHVGATTQLPSLYRNIMVAVFAEVHRVANSRHVKERPLCSTALDEAAFVDWVSSAMRAYVTCVDHIVDKLTSKSPQDCLSTQDTTVTQQNTESSPTNNCVPPRLLLMANNCHQCTDVILPAIVDQMRLQDLPGARTVLAHVQPYFKEAHDRVVSVYVEMRLQTLLGPIESTMNAASYNWRDVPPAIGARGYVHDVLVGLAQAHRELELTSPHLSRECLIQLAVEAVAEVNRVVEISDRANWSRRGHMQLVVDLRTLEAVLAVLQADRCSPRVRDRWQEAVSIMNVMRGAFRLSSDEQVAVKTAVDQERKSLSLLILGFQETGQNAESDLFVDRVAQ